MGQIVSDVTDVLDYKNTKQQARNERTKILRQMADDAAARTNLVKKTLATQRAKYGASGMSGGLTEGAVLKRLGDETAAPYDEKRRENLERLKSIKASKPNLLNTLLSRIDSLLG